MFVTKEEYESMTESQKVVVKRLKDTIEMLVECGNAMSMYRDGELLIMKTQSINLI